jgi:NAD kinase
MGASRKKHHRQQEAMRAATAERNIFEAQQRAYEEQMRRQTEALLKQQEMYEAPRTLASTVGTDGTGVRTARSQRGTTTGLSKGVASLRIPLNVGGVSGSGLNIG